MEAAMILGFKNQFEPYILDGTKTHTIRAGVRWRPGMRADLFVRPRQKDMRLLFRPPVVRVQDINIAGGWQTYSGEFFGAIRIDGARLDRDELDALAWRDGFRPADGESFIAMIQFWRGRLPFSGQLIHWDYARAVRPPAALCPLGKRIHAPESGLVKP